jgi:hypothetical protein
MSSIGFRVCRALLYDLPYKVRRIATVPRFMDLKNHYVFIYLLSPGLM